MKPPESCPNCGADVPRNAKACPECGADENTAASNLGLPDEEFDHDQFVKEEFGGVKKPRGISWLWWLTALFLITLSIFLWLY